ncbi:phage tail tape measure C-terminal domain-containing protein [Pseudotabrizicola algicola]|uniref:Phage tail tape measure protein n=1 Tax=Pseudotabrizicola algicola TaxID=2709381 RepID=A0A6B3RYF1_9RHOB|nr:phage tail tape measure C-terminal domain-containing protein [Pseudotabrizicola algicola]NEX48159.1 phage tail tape measure protein [Pseudotabrizicola algicola]
MTEKRVSVRLAAVGGRQVRAELEGVGEAGARGFGRLSREMEMANTRLAAFARRARIAAAAAAGALAAAATAMIRSGLSVIDNQAKLAASLDTTVASIQVLERAGDLAGVSMGQVEQAAMQLTRRLSQAAAGAGPATEALRRLRLSAGELQALPLDQRIALIQDRLADLVPEAERAAVASQLFGDRAALVFTRIDTATLRQATQDVRDFGVVVSDQDARQIERTNDAISRLGLIWRGLANQLAVAAAPALEAVADAMAAVARTTGPLGIAIRTLFDNLGRLTSYAATFAALMAGRWVAGLAAAALSVRGLATALVVLRGALIRTGIGALIVGAGELVYQFSRLVTGAGGFGNALELMGNVARAVWDGIKATMGSLVDDFRALRADIEGIWTRLMAFLAGKWADFLGMIGPTFNAVADRIGADFQIDWFGAQSWASMLDHAASNAGTMAERFRQRAADTRAGAFDGVREAVTALVEAVRGSGEETEGALDAAAAGARRVAEALDEAETSAGRAGAAGREAGTQTATGAEEAVTGWQAVTAALADYAARAREIGADIGQALVGAFGAAENAVADFVRKGKLDFRDLVTSMIADLARLAARRFILGPLAGLLSGVLGGAGGMFASVLHAGGTVGAAGPGRMVPALAFANAPRMHSGGWVGLKPDEVPAILQRGERVLSRREAAGYGGRGGAPSVNVTIMTRDAESFRQSRTQVAADIARAVSMGRRGL